MSLILDALRKSEAERRRGQAPDLFASLPLPAAPRRPGLLRFWPLPVIVALVTVVGVLLWPGQEAATPAVAETGQREAPEASTQYLAPNPQAAPIMRQPQPTTTAATPAIAAPNPRVPAANVTTTGPEPAPIEQPPATAQSVGMAQFPAVPLPVANASALVAKDSDAESLPPIAVLSASERADLPPLKLSMHVWASEPGKRFAIVDGLRVTEGSTAGSSIIEEIRRDGLVLNINGRRFLLPRP